MNYLPHGFTALLLALPAGAAVHTEASGKERPNIVVLVSDDQDYEHFGFAGHSLAHTPTIDRLAAEGALFTHGFVPMSRCRPAQASLLSGLWPHQNGVYFNVGADHIDPETCIATRLADAGYATIGEGKFWEYHPREMGFSNYTIRNYETFVREGQEHLFRFIDQHKGNQADQEPMFIWWAPELPHTPHNPEPRHLQKIDPSRIETPAGFQGDEAEFRKLETLSLAMGAWLDEGVAELIAKLKEAGEYENTLFCFLVDNGYANGLPSKGTAFDKGLRTPVIFTWPGGIQPSRHSELISAVDLYATLLEYGGAEPLPQSEGFSLRPAMEGKAFAGREALYGALYLQTPSERIANATRDAYAIWARTERHKYILYLSDVQRRDNRKFKIQANVCPYPERSRGDEDFFDLDTDPYELNDLSDVAENRAEMDRLQKEILAWWQETGGGLLDLP